MTALFSSYLGEIKAKLVSFAVLSDSEIIKQKQAVNQALQLRLFEDLRIRFDETHAVTLTKWAFERIYRAEFAERLKFIESLLNSKICIAAISSLPKINEEVLGFRSGSGAEILMHTAAQEAKIKSDPLFFARNLGIFDYLLDELLDSFSLRLLSDDLFKGDLYFEGIDRITIYSDYYTEYCDGKFSETISDEEIFISGAENTIRNAVTLFKVPHFDDFVGTSYSEIIYSEDLFFAFSNVEVPPHHKNFHLLNRLFPLIEQATENMYEVLKAEFFEDLSQEAKLAKSLSYFSTIITKIKESSPVIVPVGSRHHGAYVVFYNHFMVICNKGFRKADTSSLKFYKINVTNLTPLLFHNLHNLAFFSGYNKKSELQYLDFYLYRALPHALEGVSFASPFAVKDQTFGNCLFANLFCSFYVVSFIKLKTEGLVDFETALKVSKEMKRLFAYSLKKRVLDSLFEEIEVLSKWYSFTESGKKFSLLDVATNVYGKAKSKLLDYYIRKVWQPTDYLSVLNPDLEGLMAESVAAGGGVSVKELLIKL
jgi:hypothetical protein